jgi:hypothetical protein
MVTTRPATELDRRHLTIDYSSGHVLIDGRPIGTFVAEQGPEILASPAKDLYIVNVPMLVKSVTFLPSGETFAAARTLAAAFRNLAAAFGERSGSPRYSEAEVRLALAQALPERHAIERVLGALDEVAP